MRRYVRLLVLIGAALAAVVAWKWLRGAPAPELTDDEWPSDKPWPSLAEGPPADRSSATDAERTAATAMWVEPDETGACPTSHPIKGKTRSGIFHEPGGLSYARTRADRCYVDGAAAAADGLRKAKQ